MSMGQQIAVPPHVAQAIMAGQMQQQGPTVEQQIRLNAVQLAISSFNVEHCSDDLTDDSLRVRTEVIVALLMKDDTASTGLAPSEPTESGLVL